MPNDIPANSDLDQNFTKLETPSEWGGARPGSGRPSEPLRTYIPAAVRHQMELGDVSELRDFVEEIHAEGRMADRLVARVITLGLRAYIEEQSGPRLPGM